MKSRKPKHKFVQQTIVTKVVAMPNFPGFHAGKKLPTEVFDVSDYHDEGMTYAEAVEVTRAECQHFINTSKAPQAYRMEQRGVKTSTRMNLIVRRKDQGIDLSEFRYVGRLGKSDTVRLQECKGLKEFKFEDGTRIMALNQKNADRKYQKQLAEA